jgi:hypothetical protein
LVLAVAAKAQFFGYGGYYPVAPAAPVAYHGVPAAAVPAVVPAYGYSSFTSTQYHAQDEVGQARFGYAHPGQAASNYRDGLGNQIDSYAYVNPEGKEVRVSYTADSRGFRVLSNNLPVAPVANLVAVQVQDTPKVAAAKSGVAPVTLVAPVVALPPSVQDTPGVAAAKAEFAVKFVAGTPAVRAKRQVYGYGAAPFAYPGYAVSPYAYSVAISAPVREATLTKVIHTPDHAVSYRVD